MEEPNLVFYVQRKEPNMAIKQRLTDSERDDLTKDVDDLDAAYIESLKKQGIDESLLQQFADLLREDKR